MKYIIIPERKTTPQLPFYFAVEEYVARTYTDDDYFMAWRVEPTVMLGRNQLTENEVNIDYCKRNGIHIFRRKSGGGCIYADKGCMQFSYISFAENVNHAFVEYMQGIADMIKSLGINTELSGRNDILVERKKVAGSAFYRLKGRSVLHNSLLFSTELEHLAQALTPAKEKLQSKGVASVSQRVGNVGNHTDLSIEAFMDYVRKYMCGDEVLELTTDDMKHIEEIEKELASDDFTYGKNPKYTEVRKKRFADVGTIQAHIELKNQKIVNINLMGDYFLSGDLDRELLDLLHGVDFTREAVAAAIEGVEMGNVIRNFTTEQFLRLLFGRPPHVMKPDWLKINLTSKKSSGETAGILARHHMNTICTSGLCPNRTECWAARTATLMIGGEICTRKCRFCNTLSGRPNALNPHEPQHVAESIKALNLRYAVITSVDRDDLPDYGADHWVKTVEAVQQLNPDTKIELLIPDFMGKKELIQKVLATKPHVCGHNMETVRRLTPSVRSVAQYDRSLEVLAEIARNGILVTGCKRLTLGQYLQPTSKHLPVAAYISPKQFEEYKKIGLAKGFKHVVSGPLVRSSYHAAETM